MLTKRGMGATKAILGGSLTAMLMLANASAVRTGGFTPLLVASCWELGPQAKLNIAAKITRNTVAVIAVDGCRRREGSCPNNNVEKPEEFQRLHATWMARRPNV